MTELYRTEHGSHLYGLATPTSDRDFYSVVTKPEGMVKARLSTQAMGAEDVVTKDLGTFLMECEKGVPQALEAMFAPPTKMDAFRALRLGYRASYGLTTVTYRRTWRNFAEANDFKRQRHAVRLALNLRAMRRTGGRFNPRLTWVEATLAGQVAGQADGDPEYLRHLCDHLAFGHYDHAMAFGPGCCPGR